MHSQAEPGNEGVKAEPGNERVNFCLNLICYAEEFVEKAIEVKE